MSLFNYPLTNLVLSDKAEPVKQKIIRSKHKVQPHARVFKSLFSIPEEERAAKSFTSQFPFFVRTMKKFNVISSYTLVSVLIFLSTFILKRHLIKFSSYSRYITVRDIK